jgi:CheY-like chemotaxis protein
MPNIIPEREKLEEISRKSKKQPNNLKKKSLILLVEDNKNIRFIIKAIIESYDYRVIGAKNGRHALQVLSKMKSIPDLIISDIKMPKMNGYEFFKKISKDPKYLQIPFVFLSALSTPEDVRLGKLLGVDDYLTKPVNEADLLATIKGKILKNKKRVEISNELKKLIFSQKDTIDTKISEKQKNHIYIIMIGWDDHVGPNLEDYYPLKTQLPIEKIGTQLFQAIYSIYGHERLTEPETILINIENFNITGYALFDAYKDEKARGGERDFMLGVIAPKISYLQSLEIKQHLLKASQEFKRSNQINLKKYWDHIIKIFISIHL